MKKTFNFIVLFIIISISPHFVYSQTIGIDAEEPTKVIFIATNKAGGEVIRILEETKSPKFNEISIPRFLLISKNRNFALGVGGYVRAVAEYDFGGIADDPSFNTATFPAPSSTSIKNQFQMNVAHTTLFLKLVGKTKKLGDVVAYINANFTGDNYSFKLHNAYVQFFGFTVGFNFGNFMDSGADAPTIDFLGPSGMINYRVIQLSYTYKKLKHWEFTGAIEAPKVGATYPATTDGYTIHSTPQRMPNFTANVQYNWGKRSQVRAAGVVRSMTYENEHNSKMKAYSKLGWGAQLSSMMGICEPVKIFGQVSYGDGISSFINDLDILDIDLVPDPKTPGKMQTLPTLGWYAGAQYNITPNLFISSTYSQSKVYKENGWPTNHSNFFSNGKYVVANIFWDITPNMRVALEYLRGWRTGFSDHTTRRANRINMMANYSF